MSEFGETVVLKRGPYRDNRNNTITPLEDPVELNGCVVEPLGGAELAELGRTGSSNGFKVYVTGPMPRPVTGSDLLHVRGADYPVVMDGAGWMDPEDPFFGGTVITAIRGKG
ncbi:hypothetical protein NXT08_22480 [Rhodococcus pyridinivorans]|uniref:hypothetical protein n=1 Tax=Rhodococcus pyridinivorans TaxID=103816 RepID=UPI002164B637|nr:hypothetical protein [Rhodococcus pyridinivorans]UVT24971.1 hypothetical protein NXT08_22480 [Rhodococcus pyridinivorans]